MNPRIQTLQKHIEPIRQTILHHPSYSSIKSLDDLQVFMQHHVYAVWDFMSLLKTLQNQLTCTQVPWYPVGDANTRYLINEIVIGEESDVDQTGVRMSHFELYLNAMQQCGADTKGIHQFIHTLQNSRDLEKAFIAADTPEAARQFVRFTFETIQSQQPHLVAAVFTFGREDLIPGMFMQLIEDLHQRIPTQIGNFKYYLDRHIEVDGDHHSHLALEMTTRLCGEDDSKWESATHACNKALEMRNALWNGVLEGLKQAHTKPIFS